MNIVELAKNAFWAAAEFIGWKRERAAAMNTPEMKANAAAQTAAKIDGQIAAADAAAAKGDLSKARELGAE